MEGLVQVINQKKIFYNGIIQFYVIIEKNILIGNKAYKSRIKGNFDLYENCFINLSKDIENDFELKNNVYDDIHHDFY